MSVRIVMDRLRRGGEEGAGNNAGRIQFAVTHEETMRPLLLLTLLLLLAPPPALAEWTRMDGNATTTIYTDMGAIRKSTDGRQAPFMMDRSTPDSEGVRSMIDIYEFDCAGKRVRLVQSTDFKGAMGTGAIVSANRTPLEWSAVLPGTRLDVSLKSVCKAPLK